MDAINVSSRAAMRQYGHVEAISADAGNLGADIAEADDAQRAPAEIAVCVGVVTALVPALAAQIAIDPPKLPQQREQYHEHMLGDGRRIDARYVRYHHAGLGRSFDRDHVDTRAMTNGDLELRRIVE
jgi:regulator of RNase E activity RraB